MRDRDLGRGLSVSHGPRDRSQGLHSDPNPESFSSLFRTE